MVSVFLFLRHVFKPFNVVVALRNSEDYFLYSAEDGYRIST